jgi:hypothetical protein
VPHQLSLSNQKLNENFASPCYCSTFYNLITLVRLHTVWISVVIHNFMTYMEYHSHLRILYVAMLLLLIGNREAHGRVTVHWCNICIKFCEISSFKNWYFELHRATRWPYEYSHFFAAKKGEWTKNGSYNTSFLFLSFLIMSWSLCLNWSRFWIWILRKGDSSESVSSFICHWLKNLNPSLKC